MSALERERAGQHLREATVNFTSALRMPDGFSEELLSELRSAIIEVGAAWEMSDTLPKSIVNDLMGLYSWVDSSSYLHEDEDARRIRKAAIELESLIFKHVVPAPPG